MTTIYGDPSPNLWDNLLYYRTLERVFDLRPMLENDRALLDLELYYALAELSDPPARASTGRFYLISRVELNLAHGNAL